MQKCDLILATLICLLTVSCNRPVSIQPRNIADEMQRWVQQNSHKEGTSILRLRHGSCLDMTRLHSPWKVDYAHDPGPNGIDIAASGNAVGIKTFQRAGFDTSFDGVPHDGKVRVFISGWSPPNDDWGTWEVTTPKRIDVNIKSGLFKPLNLWPHYRGPLVAYLSAAERVFIDKRHYTQCRDYGSNGIDYGIMCIVISKKQDFSFSIQLDESEFVRLPDDISSVEKAIEHTRQSCIDRKIPIKGNLNLPKTLS